MPAATAPICLANDSTGRLLYRGRYGGGGDASGTWSTLPDNTKCVYAGDSTGRLLSRGSPRGGDGSGSGGIRRRTPHAPASSSPRSGFTHFLGSHLHLKDAREWDSEEAVAARLIATSPLRNTGDGVGGRPRSHDPRVHAPYSVTSLGYAHPQHALHAPPHSSPALHAAHASSACLGANSGYITKTLQGPGAGAQSPDLPRLFVPHTLPFAAGL